MTIEDNRADNREAIDTLIANGCVITMDPQRRVIEHGAVAVKAIASSPWAAPMNCRPATAPHARSMGAARPCCRA